MSVGQKSKTLLVRGIPAHLDDVWGDEEIHPGLAEIYDLPRVELVEDIIPDNLDDIPFESELQESIESNPETSSSYEQLKHLYASLSERADMILNLSELLETQLDLSDMYKRSDKKLVVKAARDLTEKYFDYSRLKDVLSYEPIESGAISYLSWLHEVENQLWDEGFKSWENTKTHDFFYKERKGGRLSTGAKIADLSYGSTLASSLGTCLVWAFRITPPSASTPTAIDLGAALTWTAFSASLAVPYVLNSVIPRFNKYRHSKKSETLGNKLSYYLLDFYQNTSKTFKDIHYDFVGKLVLGKQTEYTNEDISKLNELSNSISVEENLRKAATFYLESQKK
ncbi:MAG: hypothetical protein GOU98_00470 [Candidatus Altiarchaeota archaeon]|nr:hypothetical protein [Candidatus Altiarchaeota archaeon]